MLKEYQFFNDFETSLYGPFADNGIINVQNKRGNTGKKLAVDFGYFGGVTVLSKKLDVLDANQYVTLMDSVYSGHNRNTYLLPIDMPMQYSDTIRDFLGNQNTDWQDEITRVGSIHDIHLGVSSSTDKMNIYGGGYYTKENSYLINTWSKRTGFIFNSDFRINKWIEFGESFYLVDGEAQLPGMDNLSLAVLASPLMPVHDTANLGGYAGPLENSGLVTYPGNNWTTLVNYTGSNDQKNPVALMNLIDNKSSYTSLLSNMYLKINLFKGLSYKINYGYQLYNNQSSQNIAEAELGAHLINSEISKSTNNRTFQIVSNSINYKIPLEKHFVHLFATQSYSKYLRNSTSSYYYPDTVLYSYRKQYESQKNNWYNVGLQYSYAGKYIVGGNYNIRKEYEINEKWNSSYGLFGKYIVSNEAFLKGIKAINYLSIQGSYRKNKMTLLNENSTYGYYINPVKDLTIGGDLSLLNSRISLSVDYYSGTNERTFSRLFLTTGQSVREDFDMEVINTGWNISLSTQYRNKFYGYFVCINFTKNKNVVSYSSQDYFANYYVRVVDGYSLGSYYGRVTEGLFQCNDEILLAPSHYSDTYPGELRYSDLDVNGYISDADRDVLGTCLPELYGGLDIKLFAYNFDLLISVYGMYNYKIYNYLGFLSKTPQNNNRYLDVNKQTDALNYWTPENSDSDVPGVNDRTGENDISDYPLWFEDGDFTRLKEVQLGFSFPEKICTKIKAENLRIYFSGKNLFVLTKYSGYDPAVAPRYSNFYTTLDEGNFPLSRMFLVGLDLSF